MRAWRGYRVTKILVKKNVKKKIRTDDTTTAWVVARPTPCVPPVVLKP
jgi:hypothetical protein